MYVVQLKRMEGVIGDSKNKFDGIAKISEQGTWLATSETKGSPLHHFNTLCPPYHQYGKPSQYATMWCEF